jgi:hypothetical protein
MALLTSTQRSSFLPCAYSFSAANQGGHTKKVTMNAILLMSFCLVSFHLLQKTQSNTPTDPATTTGQYPRPADFPQRRRSPVYPRQAVDRSRRLGGDPDDNRVALVL